MAKSAQNYEFPTEHRAFLADFQALMKKHPGAAARFTLADMASSEENQQILRSGLPELECASTEWGVVCKPISPQV